MGLSVTRRELRSAFIYFVPNGTVVDGGTVAITAWPDANPTTNYTDWQFLDIEKVEIERETKSEEFDVPSTTGVGYDTDKEEWVTRRAFKCTSAKTNSLLKQLENGTSSPVTVGVAQTPMAQRTNSIDGVLLIEVKAGGVVIERTQVWARLSVTQAAGAENATSKINFEFQQLYSSLNTFLAAA